jgi:hydroxymethylbilane synthase
MDGTGAFRGKSRRPATIPVMAEQTLKLGTRGSRLALAQSEQIAAALRAAHPGLFVKLITISTTGDRITNQPLYEFGGKGLFTKELELALLDKRIDFAVHSYKDIPTTMPLVDQSALAIAATPPRADPRDALVLSPALANGRRGGSVFDLLPNGARVGTGSLRRRAQLRDRRPDLQILPLRGNIDTRLRKLDDGDESKLDAIVLAHAGLDRAGLWDGAMMIPIPFEEMLPAAGQGALALQCRADDAATRQLLAAIHSLETAACVVAERAVVRLLEGDCHSPIGALAVIDGPKMRLSTAVAARDGNPPVLHSHAEGISDEGSALAACAAGELLRLGAAELLKLA